MEGGREGGVEEGEEERGKGRRPPAILIFGPYRRPANFDWSKAFRNPLKGSETMSVLAMRRPGGTQVVAQVWVIGKLEYTTLVVNQYPTYTVKLCLTNDDRTTFRMILKKWGNLGKDWDPSSIESVINFSTRPEKVRELIELLELIRVQVTKKLETLSRPSIYRAPSHPPTTCACPRI